MYIYIYREREIVCNYIYIHTLCAYVYYVYVCMYVCMYVCIYIYRERERYTIHVVYVYVCIYIYIYTHMYNMYASGGLRGLRAPRGHRLHAPGLGEYHPRMSCKETTNSSVTILKAVLADVVEIVPTCVL